MSNSLTSIAVYVCTHRRNGPLQVMLDSLAVAAKKVQPSLPIGVVVVDDNPDGRAKEVCDSFAEEAFDLGLTYTFSGAQNISKARNLGIETALEIADWVAMVDDDQVVVDEWFEALVQTQKATGGDAVTGPVFLRYPHAGSWVSDQPFETILEAEPQPDQTKVDVCSTGNSMLRGSFLQENAAIRFRDDLGELGGEDMVFYREAVAAGLQAYFSEKAVCYGIQPPERSTLRAVLRASYWMGNTEYLTNIESGMASRKRLFLRAGRRFVAAVIRPGQQVAKKKPAEIRFALAKIAQALGIFVGIVGVRVKHQ